MSKGSNTLELLDRAYTILWNCDPAPQDTKKGADGFSNHDQVLRDIETALNQTEFEKG